MKRADGNLYQLLRTMKKKRSGGTNGDAFYQMLRTIRYDPYYMAQVGKLSGLRSEEFKAIVKGVT